MKFFTGILPHFLFTILLCPALVLGQNINLVPNSGFESYSQCPYDQMQLNYSLPWMNPSTNTTTTGSPDYFNQCSSLILNVPNAYLGFQQAHSGGAYCGICLNADNLSDCREYIETPLNAPLISGVTYHLSMYVNIANQSTYTTDAIGAYFSDTAITGVDNFAPLPFTPQVNSASGNLFDTLNWTLVEGFYTANGGENYVIIGNFKNDLSTYVVPANSSGWYPGVYCYIDDVTLECYGDCPPEPIVPEVELIIPNVFSPNGDGLNDAWKIELPSSNTLQSLEIYDRWGIKIAATSDLTTSQMDKTKVVQWFGRTTSGMACNEGVYYYTFEVKNSKGEIEKYKGYISLFR